MDEHEKSMILRVKKSKSVQEVLEEVEVLIDARFFNEFSETKSSWFLKNAIENQNVIEVKLF